MFRIDSGRRGFTLVELMVVMAIIALLLTLALPRYFDGLQRAKEASLRQDLSILRDQLDKFYGDKGVHPMSLDDLLNARYLRSLPTDPITERADTWVPAISSDPQNPGIIDIHSGAEGAGMDGTPYANW